MSEINYNEFHKEFFEINEKKRDQMKKNIEFDAKSVLTGFNGGMEFLSKLKEKSERVEEYNIVWECNDDGTSDQCYIWEPTEFPKIWFSNWFEWEKAGKPKNAFVVKTVKIIGDWI